MWLIDVAIFGIHETPSLTKPITIRQNKSAFIVHYKCLPVNQCIFRQNAVENRRKVHKMDIFDGKTPPMPKGTDGLYALVSSMTAYPQFR